MLDEETTDETTEINWDCYDGAEDSVITIDEASVNSKPQDEFRAAQEGSRLREKLEREQIENSTSRPSFLGKIFKVFLGRD